MTAAATSALHDHHRTMLESESGIHPDLVSARGYRTVTDAAELKKLSFSPKQQNVPALLIPIYSPTGEIKLYQARPDTPRLDERNKTVKYETPAGSQMALDVHPLAKNKVADPTTALFVTEGIKKGDALVTHGLCAVALIGVWNWRGTNGQGGKTALPEWEFIALNDRLVYIVFDSDVMSKKEVAAALVRLKAMLEHKGAKVRVIYLPDAADGAKWGVDDYLAAGHSVDDLKALATSEVKGSDGVTVSDEIIVNRQIKEVVRDVSAKLRSLEVRGHPVIYSRGDGLLVEMMPNSYELREVTKPDSTKALLHDHLEPVYEKTLQNGEVIKTPAVFSNNHTALLTRKTAEFPPIKAVSDIPLMLSDGTILSEPGYHREHGYYLNTAQIEVQLMPWQEARALYLETFNEMSYQAPKAGFTATMAFILQPFLMPMIDDLTPLYAVLGSRRAGSGTGKGFLLDCVYRIHRGRPYTHDGSMPATDEEMGKVLFSALSEGVSHIIFDDIDHLKHRQLMAAITSRTYKGRILGVSQRHEVSTGVTWAVSGNAPDIHRDFYRRVIPVYMGVGTARAWERPYTRPDLNRYILENRNLFVSAALSILEHWRSLGMPLSTHTIRGFDRWSAVMGGVLEAIGLPHLLEARDGLDELIEVDNSDLDLLITAWRECGLVDKPLRGRDILSLARDRELFTELHDGRSDAAGAGELGKYLKPFVNDVFGAHYLRRAFDSHAKTWSYYLEPVPETPKALSEVFDFSPEKITPLHPRNTPAKQPDPADSTVAGVMRGSTGKVSTGETKRTAGWSEEI